LKRIAYYVMIAASALGGALLPCHAGKITVDPNLRKPTPVVRAAAPTDPNLLQKVTYSSGGDKRLHTILNDVAAATGVSISCGKSKDDWPVRDLPLIVCVKDVPLGTVLQSIADCAHLELFSSQTKKGWVHHIRSDGRLEDLLAKRNKALLARAGIEWDLWTQLAAASDDELHKKCDAVRDLHYPMGGAFSCASIRDLAKIVAALGPDNKRRMLAGDQIVVTLNDPSADLAARLSSFCEDVRKVWVAQREKAGSAGAFFASDVDDERVSLSFYLRDVRDEPGRLGLQLEGVEGPRALELPHEWTDPLVANLPEADRSPMEDFDGLYRLGAQDEDHTEPGHLDVLDVKLDLPKPDRASPANLADTIAAIHKSTGFSFICENYPLSHDMPVRPAGNNETTIGDWLLSQIRETGTCWWLDVSRKLLVGCSTDWVSHQENLVPESMITTLRSKMDLSGVELEDALPAMGLSQGQIKEWLMNSDDLGQLAFGSYVCDRPIWQLYCSLSDEDKALAGSEMGLSLAKLDPKFVREQLERARRALKPEDVRSISNGLLMAHPDVRDEIQRKFYAMHPELRDKASVDMSTIDLKQVAKDLKQLQDEASEEIPELKNLQRFPADTETIGKLVMRVVKTDTGPRVRVRNPSNGRVMSRSRADGIEQHGYAIAIQGAGFNYFTIPVGGFPVYSLEREKQVLEEQKQKKEKK